jgi:hypothetical protein
MDNATPNQVPAPMPPAPTPAPAPLPAPVPQVGVPSYEGGGGLPGSPSVVKKEGFFTGVTLSEVLITALVTFGLLYSIYYTRQRMAYLSYEQKGSSATA